MRPNGSSQKLSHRCESWLGILQYNLPYQSSLTNLSHTFQLDTLMRSSADDSLKIDDLSLRLREATERGAAVSERLAVVQVASHSVV